MTLTPYRVTLYLSNLSSKERTLAVCERVLVSDIDKVRVIVDKEHTTDEKAPDENGFVDWTVSLAGHENREIHLAYTVKKHENVVGIDL